MRLSQNSLSNDVIDGLLLDDPSFFLGDAAFFQGFGDSTLNERIKKNLLTAGLPE